MLNQKKILVISYSQTGQLTSLVNNFIKPLKEQKNITLIQKTIKPKNEYPFPWNMMTFMDTFPEAVYMDSCPIEEFETCDDEYDLIILAYQVWFLSPSIPISSFLKSSWAKNKLKNKPVVTLIACRNMWIMAQEKVKLLLDDIGAKLIDNVVLVDKGNTLETFITTPRWMLTGKRDSIFGLSSAGVCDDEIKKTKRFGKALVEALNENKEKEYKSLLYGLKAVEVDVKLIKSEKIGAKSFTIWGAWIRKLGKPGNSKRKPLVILYLIFLLLMIVTVVPINMIVQTIIRKLNKKAVLKQKEYYEKPSGSRDERIKEFL